MNWEEVNARVFSFEKDCIKYMILGTRKLIKISLIGRRSGYNSTRRYKLIGDKLYKRINELG